MLDPLSLILLAHPVMNHPQFVEGVRRLAVVLEPGRHDGECLLGLLQFGFTTAGAGLAAWAFGYGPASAFFIGCLFGLSSTAIVLNELHSRDEIESVHGRGMLGILLFQDLAVVPLMLLVPLLAGTGQQTALWVVLLKATGLVVGIWRRDPEPAVDPVDVRVDRKDTIAAAGEEQHAVRGLRTHALEIEQTDWQYTTELKLKILTALRGGDSL